MKIISWNVNGIRAWREKDGTLDFVQKVEQPDIFCIQESKAQPEQITDIFPEYAYQYLNSAEKKGYSGTGIFSKIEPISVNYGLPTLPKNEQDTEGRVITLEFKKFFIITVYTPNSKPDLARLSYRYDIWDKAFLKHMKKLEKKKPVIVCGDLNVAHEPIDIARPDNNKTTATKPGSPGFTNQERERFSDFLNAEFIDTYRHLYPEKIQYSWWSYRAGARKNNVGWRIDYFLISPELTKKLEKAAIYDQALGSDHCPVGIEIKL